MFIEVSNDDECLLQRHYKDVVLQSPDYIGVAGLDAVSILLCCCRKQCPGSWLRGYV
jgi:hypothetical protein